MYVLPIKGTDPNSEISFMIFADKLLQNLSTTLSEGADILILKYANFESEVKLSC